MTHRTVDRGGFTLVELLVASALFLGLLTAFAAILGQMRSASQAREAQQAIVVDREAIAQLLQYELSLAGYGGLGSVSLLTEGTPTLTLAFEATAHTVSVHYVEDRFTPSGPEVRSARYWVDPEGQALMRAVNEGAANVMATGVASLSIEGYLRRDFGIVDAFDAVTCGGACPPPEFVAGLVLRLEFVEGPAMDVAVGFYNAQRVTVLP